MKRFFTIIFLSVLPLILLELLLYFPAVYKKVLLNDTGIDTLTASQMKDKQYPQTIIMGSSLMRYSIDEKTLQKTLDRRSIHTNIANISVGASTTANDYFTLLRILKTCIVCPRTIIYGPTDIAMQPKFDLWTSLDEKRLQLLYFQDNEFQKKLLVAAQLDPLYRTYVQEMNKEMYFRIYFLRFRLLEMLHSEIYQLVFHTDPSQAKLLYAQQHEIPDIQYGFQKYSKGMTDEMKQSSKDRYKDYYSAYTIGGAGKFFFDTYLDLVKKKNIHLFIVLAPMYYNFHTAYAQEKDKYIQYVYNKAEEYNYPVINGELFHSKNDQLFGDPMHLNFSGSQNFSTYVGSEMSTHLINSSL